MVTGTGTVQEQNNYSNLFRLSKLQVKQDDERWSSLKKFEKVEKNILRDGELNPGLPRDRRGYSPLYYLGYIYKLEN